TGDLVLTKDALYQLSYPGIHRFAGRARVATPNDVFRTSAQVFRDRTVFRLQCASAPSRYNGGRGRIRTSVARKERQIYSLLVLATHPPVPQEHRDLRRWSRTGELRNAERARVQRHQPVRFSMRGIHQSQTQNPDPQKFSWRRELNPRPSDYKSDALPAELRQHAKPCKPIMWAIKLQGGASSQHGSCQADSGIIRQASTLHHSR